MNCCVKVWPQGWWWGCGGYIVRRFKLSVPSFQTNYLYTMRHASIEAPSSIDEHASI
jgi:hypothetical protein